MKKYFWVSYFFVTKEGPFGFNSLYFENLEGDFIDFLSFQSQLARDLKVAGVSIINYKEVNENIYNKSMARNVSHMENIQKQLKENGK